MKHTMHWSAGRAAAWLALAALAAAGTSTQGGGGVTGTGNVAQGVISDFGSLFVNGIEYFTEGADLRINREKAQESRLRVGMKVRIEGETFGDGKTGQARTVRYDVDLRGPVDGAPAPASEGMAFAIGGLVVLVAEDTVMDGLIGPAGLGVGDRVEVSGLRDERTGALRATYLSRRDVAPGTVLTGEVASLSDASFMVGAVTFRRDDSRLEGADRLSEGMTVRVSSPDAISSAGLRPERVEVLAGDLGASPGTRANSEGVVSGVAESAFLLGDLVVRLQETTTWRGGTAAGLREGVRVEAEGMIDAGAALVAERVTFKAPDVARVDARVASRTGDGFLLFGADGVQVVVDGGTVYSDQSASRSATFGLAEVRAADRLVVDGDEVRDGVVRARSVTRREPGGTVSLVARARGAGPGAVALISLRVSGGAATLYRDVDGATLAADAFFAKAAGRRILAVGNAVQTEVTAEVLQLMR